MTRGRLHIVSLICLFFAIGVAGCRRQAQADLFPDSNEVTGWQRTGDLRTFPAAELWKYMDGEAERYIKAGIQTTLMADYTFNGRFEAVAEIYRMDSAAGVEQIFESEPAAEAELVSLGDGARLYRQNLLFRKGRYLVRINAFDTSAEVKPALLTLARGIEQRLSP